MAMPIFEDAYLEISEINFSFPKFATVYQKSVHSIYSFLKSVPWHPFSTISTKNLFDQL